MHSVACSSLAGASTMFIIMHCSELAKTLKFENCDVDLKEASQVDFFVAAIWSVVHCIVSYIIF